MQNEGKLYGKVGRRHIPLAMTTDDVQAMDDKLELMRLKVFPFLERLSTREESPDYLFNSYDAKRAREFWRDNK